MFGSAPSSAQGYVTKQKIMECAASMFSEKGFTETSVRELIKAVGLKNPASFYSHFTSKNAILEEMLEDYVANNTDVFENKNITKILQENPTTDGIMSCLETAFAPDRLEYYLNVLCVMLQEQLRNAAVRKQVTEAMILRSEKNSGKIIEKLKELGVISRDTDTDYWTKVISSLYYSFAARRMLGIGDTSPGFTGKGMADLLRHTFDTILELGGARGVVDDRPGEGGARRAADDMTDEGGAAGGAVGAAGDKPDGGADR